MWQRIKALIYKEFLATLRDPKSRRAIILPPLIQLFIFAFAATLDVQDVSIGILNRDNGKNSFELVERLSHLKTFSPVTYLHAVEEIGPFIDTRQGVIVLSIDEQFSRNLEAKKPAAVQLILDGRNSNTTQIVAGYITSIVDQYNSDFAKEAKISMQQAAIIPRNWYNPNLLYYWYTVPSLFGILTMVEALILTALSIARERELGTFDQLLVSPLQPIEILIGKTIPPLIISMGASTLILIVAIFVFQIPFTGSLLALYASTLVFSASIVGVGLFISSLCETQQQALLGSMVFTSPSILLSGFTTPIENMPNWLQPITFLMPLRYFLVVAKGSFLKAMPASIVFMNTWPMAIIAICTLSVATWLFRHRLE